MKQIDAGMLAASDEIVDQEVNGHACESWTISAWYCGSSLSSCLALGANMDLQFTQNKNQILVSIAVVIGGPLRMTMMYAFTLGSENNLLILSERQWFDSEFIHLFVDFFFFCCVMYGDADSQASGFSFGSSSAIGYVVVTGP